MVDLGASVRALAKNYSDDRFVNLLRQIAPRFRPITDSLDFALHDNDSLRTAAQLGVMELDDVTSVLVASARTARELTSRSGRRQQYEFAKRVLKDSEHNAGIFVFYDNEGRFRLSLITITYHGTRRRFSTYRRYTFFVDPELPNKTFVQQFRRAHFATLSDILETFSLEAVSDQFYREFKPKYDSIAESVQGTTSQALKQDFALLFVIRTIFLGFVQKRGWLGNNPRFLQDFWNEYRNSNQPADTFYRQWLEPLFFEALNNPPGQKIDGGNVPFSAETQQILQMAPYLNGELFKRKEGVDDQGLWIPDEQIGDFFDFLFQYNFTVEENELYDEELELNPEFLGIIFERLTNMEQGAVYTPRVEVDMMCRLALVYWLTRTTDIDRRDLYHLFFREAGIGQEFDEHQKQGDFSPAEIRTLIDKLENVTICDPAAGSGAFEVGMLQVLDQILENLYERNNTPADLKSRKPSPFERKKAIIERSLYGVEVKRWAVWINHLRLWLTLFVDMPDKYQHSFKPLLPNLTFKVRTGDSLVQRIGKKTFPVQGHAKLPAAVKRKITELKKQKRDFFYNQNLDEHLIEQAELEVFRAILDAEIAERQEAIRKLQRPIESNLSFISSVSRSDEQRRAQQQEERKRQIDELQAEIADLEEQKRNLHTDRPFIWSIEFAEIFFDRGGFDIIIGNPPYVRQEAITDPLDRLSAGEYKNALLEMVRLDFPDYFAKSRAHIDQFKKGRRPNGRSDLYTYFYIRSLRLLNPQGVHVFICSNAWLDVGYGAWLQEFFLRQAPLHLVIDNHARRSFARADVNTIITVAAAPQRVPADHVVRFVAFKQPFEEVVLSEHLLEITSATELRKTNAFRVFPITAGELLAEGSDDSSNNGEYVGDKWGGKYLRAPDIFFTILEKGKGKLVRLGDIAEVRRGITTGANDFFYLEPLGPGSRPGLLRVRNGAGWEGEIEEEFLKPVIKSPRECRTILIHPEDLKYRIFMCHKSKEELKGTKALEYIEWGEEQGYHLRPSCTGRYQWWSLPDVPHAKLHFNYLINDVGRTFVGNCYASDNFHEIRVSDEYAVFLNSVVFMLFQGIVARANFGGGLAKIQTYELQRMQVSNFDNVSLAKKILNAGIQSIFTECGIDPESDVPIAEQEPKPLPDRKTLDDIIFDALGLTEEERKEVYRAVCQLVWERISKARSV